jgi:hypothetical protein
MADSDVFTDNQEDPDLLERQADAQYSAYVASLQRRKKQIAEFKKQNPFMPAIQPAQIFRDSTNRIGAYTHEQWQDDHMDFILDLWHQMQHFIDDNNVTMLDRCRFNDFVKFVSTYTTLHRNPYLSLDANGELR